MKILYFIHQTRGSGARQEVPQTTYIQQVKLYQKARQNGQALRQVERSYWRLKRMVMGRLSDGYPCRGPITIPTSDLWLSLARTLGYGVADPWLTLRLTHGYGIN